MVFIARKRSLGQGNVFTPVCHSVHRRGSAFRGDLHPEGGLHPGGSASIGGSASKGGLHRRLGGGSRTPHWILWDTVNERTVRILLECILVEAILFTCFIYWWIFINFCPYINLTENDLEMCNYKRLTVSFGRSIR